jgi:hypothetical protein
LHQRLAAIGAEWLKITALTSIQSADVTSTNIEDGFAYRNRSALALFPDSGTVAFLAGVVILLPGSLADWTLRWWLRSLFHPHE